MLHVTSDSSVNIFILLNSDYLFLITYKILSSEKLANNEGTQNYSYACQCKSIKTFLDFQIFSV